MIRTPFLERTETADELLRAAHRQAYLLSEHDLIGYLKRVLGRPLIAHITGPLSAARELHTSAVPARTARTVRASSAIGQRERRTRSVTPTTAQVAQYLNENRGGYTLEEYMGIIRRQPRSSVANAYAWWYSNGCVHGGERNVIITATGRRVEGVRDIRTHGTYHLRLVDTAATVPTLSAATLGTADANNVSRWASGRSSPDRAVWERLRTLATLHIALTAIVGSESSGAQWFTGANPSLGFKMPADELRADNDAPVFAAVRDLAQR
jgi:hypothetical protein